MRNIVHSQSILRLRILAWLASSFTAMAVKTGSELMKRVSD